MNIYTPYVYIYITYIYKCVFMHKWYKLYCKNMIIRTSLVVEWLRLCPSTAGGMGLVPGRGTKILHATWCSQKKKKKKKIIFSMNTLCILKMKMMLPIFIVLGKMFLDIFCMKNSFVKKEFLRIQEKLHCLYIVLLIFFSWEDATYLMY